jgi:hypothetical protein
VRLISETCNAEFRMQNAEASLPGCRLLTSDF